ncbi:BRRG2, response regulator [Bisporella sp. PMI_857]|nr:BRRG2, response regulator [Bisporella sp. PMI_857]
MNKSDDMAGSATNNNSSDFVRKLYKMLEDSSHLDIVRWGEDKNSFVVLENDKFTKNILPKHFKHSNFASFVRQLNKYDFHKVRQNNEDNTPSQYGPGAWEFRHPDFRADNKDSLDNIRRKAPTTRKPTQNAEDGSMVPSQQIDLIHGQLLATQQQLQQMHDKYNDLAQGHVILLQQVVQLQKFVKNHDAVMKNVMGFLHVVDGERRSSAVGAPYDVNTGQQSIANDHNKPDEHPASPLQNASKLLNELPVEHLPDTNLEKLTHHNYNVEDFSTPPNDQSGSGMVPRSEGSKAAHHFTVLNDLDNMVYPVGQTNGIDPINSEHANNIPYALPANGVLAVESTPDDIHDETSGIERKHVGESVWGPTKPRVLLVEDDRLCAKIGSKFLQSFECGVEIAQNGLEAVSKVNNGRNQFDVILMDIIMPHLDGVSATVCIREIHPHLPIVAMTSNIRADDINMYFRYGMNDVLPKPFTKDGMLRILMKNLPHYLKESQYSQPAMQTGGFVSTNQPPRQLGLNMGQLAGAAGLKDETSAGKSPASATWNSPTNQMPHPSTPLANNSGNFMQQPMRDPGQYASMPPIQQQMHQPQSVLQQQQMIQQQANIPPQPGLQQSGYAPAPMGVNRGPPHRRVMSDMSGAPAEDSPDAKRQRMYGPPGSFAQ